MMEQTPLSPIFWNKVLGGGTPGPTPSGTISITENGTYDVAGFAEAEVNVAGGGADLSVAELFVADFIESPPIVTNGALDGWNRAVVS